MPFCIVVDFRVSFWRTCFIAATTTLVPLSKRGASSVVREPALRQRLPHFRCIAGVSELGLRQPQRLPRFCCSVSFFTTATAAAAFSHVALYCRVISSVNCMTAASEAATRVECRCLVLSLASFFDGGGLCRRSLAAWRKSGPVCC